MCVYIYIYWSCFVLKEKFLLTFFSSGLWGFLVGSKWNPFVIWQPPPPPPPQSRDGNRVMYYSQVMLVPVLTVKGNDLVTLRKYEATCTKGNRKWPGTSCSWMLWNYLEDSRNSISQVMDIKAGPVPKGGRVSSNWQSRAIPGPSVRVRTFTGWDSR